VHNPARRLTLLSFAVSSWLSDGEPWGYHAVNVALHLGNVALLLALAWLVLPPWGAVLSAAVFALHPLQVEAVAYVSSRADLLAAFGVLLALLSASIGSLAGAIVGVVVACLGKETAVMAWLVVPLWALATDAPFPVKRFCQIGLGLALIGAVVFLSRVTHVGLTMDADLIGRTAASVVRLTSLVFVPIGLSIDHDWHGVPLWLQGVSVSVVLVGTLAALVYRTPYRLGWLLTIIWVLPRFVVQTPEGLHERHMYFPLVGWALCAGAWLTAPSRTRI
jgi:protein O-mannosyl-transferase